MHKHKNSKNNICASNAQTTYPDRTQMTKLRLPYHELSAPVLEALNNAKKALSESSLNPILAELVYIRVSQINGCSLCIYLHTKTAKKQGETERRLTELAGWRMSRMFNEAEKAALAWAEAITNISESHADNKYYEPLLKHFSEQEISDLSYAIALINAMNRLAISMHSQD